MLTKTYELPMSREYVRHWGVVEAMRELFQNALDSESPFECEVIDDSMAIRSRFSTLDPKSLLLGATTKAESTDTIGSFGEGYKIALLVLAREGYPVTVFNGGLIWTPMFKHSKKYESEVFCIKSRLNGDPDTNKQGLSFHVGGLTDDVLEDLIASNRHLREVQGEIRQTSKGDILLEEPGRLYVNGLFVCPTSTKHGYNIKPEFLQLERDRQTVSNWDLNRMAEKMWFEVEDWVEVADMIEAEADEMEHADWNAPAILKDALYERFKEAHPDKIVATSHQEVKDLAAAGITNTVYIGGSYGACVKASDNYTHSMAPRIDNPKEILARWLAENRRHMRRKGIQAFKKLLKEVGGWSR